MPPRGLILVVEPDDLILGLLEQWLGEAGYAVRIESSPGPPGESAGRGEPLLVIIDVPTPRNAEETIRYVKEAYGCPVLLLSARFRRGTGSSSDVARELGVDKVLPKPFTRDELLSSVSEAVEGT